MKFLKSLDRKQKEAIGLLQIGTFLEYFDLMLYVHMAVLLNELFFPNTDPHTASLLAAFAFCSTYVLRPFGALIFGYIGDNIGRKSTVIFTTMMMSLSCILMANLPTYAQIGITASWACYFMQNGTRGLLHGRNHGVRHEAFCCLQVQVLLEKERPTPLNIESWVYRGNDMD